MKIRKFDFSEKGPVITKDGEFLHINDVILLLKEERETWQNCLESEKKHENPSEITKRMILRYEERVDLLDTLLTKIRKGE